MANIKPFRAFRPTRDKVHLVASRSYISYKKADLIRKLDENPFTFLHILNPEYKTKTQSFTNSIEKFEKVKVKFTDFVNQQILIQDTKPFISKTLLFTTTLIRKDEYSILQFQFFSMSVCLIFCCFTLTCSMVYFTIEII